MNKTIPTITFHVIEGKKKIAKNLSVTFEYCKKQIIDHNKKFIIGDKYFSELKDKFKTFIILNLDEKSCKFLISLYYGENYITILKTRNLGACFEVIQIYSKSIGIPLNKIDFDSGDNYSISVVHFDTINNLFRRRFLMVNFPIKIKLNIKNLNKMEENSSYKINILPNDIIVQKNNVSNCEKIKMHDFKEMKEISKEIDKTIQEINLKRISSITKKLSPYEYYFNQYLINKAKFEWNSDEFESFYHYCKFKLFLNYSCVDEKYQVEYYISANKIFTNIYEELSGITNVNYYEKICAITSFYRRLKSDFENKENKDFLIGEYKLININDNKNYCYKLVYDFINNIINNLKENSKIFSPLLQVNSGFNKNINSIDEKEIFELSMLNVDMVKRHLKSLMPKLMFTIRHRSIKSKRGSIDKMAGNIFIYESSIFRNKFRKSAEEIINEQPKDAAVTISFVLLHEFFMHKTIRSNFDFTKGRETPPKFIGPKFDINNFYYSKNKKNLDPLSVYNTKENENTIAKVGESGKMLEYFFENENFEIIYYLKKYLGFGDLLDNVNLIVDENLDKLHNYVKDKIEKKEVKPLYEKKSDKNCKDNFFEESDEDKKEKKDGEEEEEEEEEERELSEETKNILNSQTDCY